VVATDLMDALDRIMLMLLLLRDLFIDLLMLLFLEGDFPWEWISSWSSRGTFFCFPLRPLDLSKLMSLLSC